MLVKIPQKVIQTCVGLAIFTTMRAGATVSGSAGSGILIAKTMDGNWSPPTGILVHTVSLWPSVRLTIALNNFYSLE